MSHDTKRVKEGKAKIDWLVKFFLYYHCSVREDLKIIHEVIRGIGNGIVEVVSQDKIHFSRISSVGSFGSLDLFLLKLIPVGNRICRSWARVLWTRERIKSRKWRSRKVNDVVFLRKDGKSLSSVVRRVKIQFRVTRLRNLSGEMSAPLWRSELFPFQLNCVTAP